MRLFLTFFVSKKQQTNENNVTMYNVYGTVFSVSVCASIHSCCLEHGGRIVWRKFKTPIFRSDLTVHI